LFFHVHGFLDHILFFDVLAIYCTLPGDSSIGGLHNGETVRERQQMKDSDEVRSGTGEVDHFLFYFIFLLLIGVPSSMISGATGHMPENDEPASCHHRVQAYRGFESGLLVWLKFVKMDSIPWFPRHRGMITII
jgi:hypothetical protein